MQEEQGAERLILCRGTDPAAHGEVGEKLDDLGRPHLRRMPLAVKEDVSTRPADVGLLGGRL